MPSEVFDLDAVAAEADGGPGPFVFTFGGQRFEIPAAVDIRGAALIGDANWFGALRVFLGADQFEKLSEVDEMLTLKRCIAVLEAYSKHVRSSLGESEVSTASSSSTAKRSRPTSKPTTKSA